MTTDTSDSIEQRIAALQARLTAVEDERAVRNLLARYMKLCDQPCNDHDAPQLGELFAADAIWEGVGALYTQTFGHQQGRDAIVTFLGGYLAPRSTHFSMNAHFLTADAVTVSGTQAHGQWVMQQVSTYEDGRSELIGARLTIDFSKQDGQWQMAHFRTQRLFCMPWDAAGKFTDTLPAKDA
jgi:hypothetical protein